MESTTDKSPFDVEAISETEESVLQELEDVEQRLAKLHRLPLRHLRRRLPDLIRSGVLAEDAVVMRWLSVYETAMEYAAERNASASRK